MIHSFCDRYRDTKSFCFLYEIAAECFEFGAFSGSDIALKRTGGVISIFMIELIENCIDMCLSDGYMLRQRNLISFLYQIFLFFGFYRIISDLADGIVIICSGYVVCAV